jgi:hypothetical protein
MGFWPISNTPEAARRRPCARRETPRHLEARSRGRLGWWAETKPPPGPCGPCNYIPVFSLHFNVIEREDTKMGRRFLLFAKLGPSSTNESFQTAHLVTFEENRVQVSPRSLSLFLFNFSDSKVNVTKLCMSYEIYDLNYC